MPQAPFKTTGFMPPGQAYRLLTLGINPPTKYGYGRLTPVNYQLNGLAGFLVDSGPNNQTLIVANNVQVIPSPAGVAFGDASLFYAAGLMQGPPGVTNSQGAVSGTKFSIEIIYNVANAALAPTIGRPNDQCYITGSVAAGWTAFWWDSGGTSHSISGGTYAAGLANIALTWDGVSIRLFVGGILVNTLAMVSVRAANSRFGLQISGNAGDSITQLRYSTVCRETATYTPSLVPLPSDPNTGCLYYFD